MVPCVGMYSVFLTYFLKTFIFRFLLNLDPFMSKEIFSQNLKVLMKCDKADVTLVCLFGLMLNIPVNDFQSCTSTLDKQCICVNTQLKSSKKQLK